jgi:rubrerythrin
MSKKTVDILLQFSYNENRIKKLYLLYARAFPEQKKDWEKLAAEEKKHAAALLELSEKFDTQDSFIKVSPYALKILNYTRRFLDSQIMRIEKRKINSQQAIVVAIRLELSMLDKKSFDIFTPASEEIKIVLARLNRETKEHATRLQRMLSQITTDSVHEFSEVEA